MTPTKEEVEVRLIRLKLWMTGIGENPSQEMIDIEFLLARDADKDKRIRELEAKLIVTKGWDSATHAEELAEHERVVSELRKQMDKMTVLYTSTHSTGIYHQERAEKAEALVAQKEIHLSELVMERDRAEADLSSEVARHIKTREERDHWMNLECYDCVHCPHIETLREKEQELAAMTKEWGEAEAAYLATLASITPEHQNKIIGIQKKMIDRLEDKLAAIKSEIGRKG